MPLSIQEAEALGDKELEFQTEATKRNSLIGTIGTNDKLIPIDRAVAKHLGMIGQQKRIKERLGKMKRANDTNYFAVKQSIIRNSVPEGTQTTDRQYYEPKVLKLLEANHGKGYQSNEIAKDVRFLQCFSDKADKKEFSNIMKSIAKNHNEIKILKHENELYYYIK